MRQERSRAWRVAERLGLVEEPGLRPVGSRAWWMRLVLAFGVAVVTFALLSLLGLLYS